MMPRNRILPVFIPHLGCPHQCVFCNQNEITGTVAAKALAELEKYCTAPGAADCELALYGGSFTTLPVTEQLCYLDTARGNFRSIRLSTRPDAIDRETLCRLLDYGVATIELGAQSMRDEVLTLSGRGHSAEDVRQATRMIHEAGFKLVLQMMTGLPGDDDDGAVYTAEELISLQPDAVRIYPTVIVRGTELERRWREGEYQEHTVEDAVRVCACLLPLFEKAKIPVIRLGLNPTEELSGGAAVAGAYHPALGELVRSRILRNEMEALLQDTDCDGKEVTIRVPAQRLSQAIGQKKSNLIWLKSRFPALNIRIAVGDQDDDLHIDLH